MFHTNGCSEKYKKKGQSPRLFEKMTDQTHSIYASTGNFSCASFLGTFFGSWKQKFLK